LKTLIYVLDNDTL